MNFKQALEDILDEMRNAKDAKHDKFRFMLRLLTVVNEFQKPESVIPPDAFSGLDADERKVVFALFFGGLIHMASE